MSEIVAGIGAGTVLVFQPATPSGAGFEVALGIQRFWQKSLKSAGRPAACFLTAASSVVMRPQRHSFERTSAAFAAAFGQPSNRATPRSPTAIGRSSGTSPSIFSMRVSRSFDGGYAEMPAHVTSTLIDVGRRVGVKLPWSTAAQAFDTADPGAMMLTLELMGVLSMAEDGCRMTIAMVLDRLGLLVGAAPGSAVVVALVPELLGHLSRLGAHDLQLAGWMKRMRSNVGALPPEWEGLVERIVRERSR